MSRNAIPIHHVPLVLRAAATCRAISAALRQQRGLKPGQLAAALGASNVSKVGSLIRAFELGEPLSDHWLQKLVAELQPDPTELRRCLEPGSGRCGNSNLNKSVLPGRPGLMSRSNRFFPFATPQARVSVRKVPRAFCNSREQAEGWAADELKRCP